MKPTVSYKVIMDTLEANDALCMDDERDRDQLASALHFSILLGEGLSYADAIERVAERLKSLKAETEPGEADPGEWVECHTAFTHKEHPLWVWAGPPQYASERRLWVMRADILREENSSYKQYRLRKGAAIRWEKPR